MKKDSKYSPHHKTYGTVVNENRQKNPINDKTLEDDARDSFIQWERDLLEKRDALIARTLEDPKFHNKDFYVVLLFKIEKMTQQPRSWVLARHSCPTPTYHQTVFKFNRVSSELEFLWSIPSEIKYYWLLSNAFNLPKEYHMAVKFVTLMESGELLQWAIKENGGKPDGLIKDEKNKPYFIDTHEEKKEPECRIILP